jgi:hypothetical protein
LAYIYTINEQRNAMNARPTAEMMQKGLVIVDANGTEWKVLNAKPYGWEVRGWSVNGRSIGIKVMFEDDLQFCTLA